MAKLEVSPGLETHIIVILNRGGRTFKELTKLFERDFTASEVQSGLQSLSEKRVIIERDGYFRIMPETWGQSWHRPAWRWMR